MCVRWALFLSDVDYHGPSRIITRNGSCLRLIFWLIICLLAWAMLIYDIYNMSRRYHDYPLNTETYVQSKREMLFPAVTICNKNPLSNTPPRGVNQSERDYYSTNGYKFDDLVTSCQFMPLGSDVIPGVNCTDYLNVIQTQVFPYGNCYTFNSAAATPGSDEDDDKLQKTDTPGIMGGLRLEMNPSNGVVNQQYVAHAPAFLYDTVPGVVVQVHNPRAPADMRRGRKFQVSGLAGPNNVKSRYDVVISKTREYRMLQPPYGDCEGKARGPAWFRLPKLGGDDDDDDEDKEEKDAGSPDECVKRCLRRRMREKNNCTLYDLWDDADGPNYECQNVATSGDAAHNLANSVHNVDTEASLTVDVSLGECQEECPEPCVRTQYDYQVDEYKATTTGVNTLNVYFADFSIEETVQSPFFTMARLLKEIGIYFVVMTGFSFISFMHLLEFLIDLCLHGCQRKREVADDEENGVEQ